MVEHNIEYAQSKQFDTWIFCLFRRAATVTTKLNGS